MDRGAWCATVHWVAKESDITGHTHNLIEHKLYSSSKIHVHGHLQSCWDEDFLRYRKCDTRAAELIFLSLLTTQGGDKCECWA